MQVSEITEIITGLSENWKGAAALLLIFAGAFIGPLLYIVKRQLDFQEREGRENRTARERESGENRQAHKEASQMYAAAIQELARAVHQLDITIKTRGGVYGTAQERG